MPMAWSSEDVLPPYIVVAVGRESNSGQQFAFADELALDIPDAGVYCDWLPRDRLRVDYLHQLIPPLCNAWSFSAGSPNAAAVSSWRRAWDLTHCVSEPTPTMLRPRSTSLLALSPSLHGMPTANSLFSHAART